MVLDVIKCSMTIEIMRRGMAILKRISRIIYICAIIGIISAIFILFCDFGGISKILLLFVWVMICIVAAVIATVMPDE